MRYLPLVVWFGCRFLFFLCGPFVLLSDSVFLCRLRAVWSLVGRFFDFLLLG